MIFRSYYSCTQLDNMEDDHETGTLRRNAKDQHSDRLSEPGRIAWELVLDYQTYKQEIKDNDDVCRVFDQFAEDEAMHARRFRQLLLGELPG